MNQEKNLILISIVVCFLISYLYNNLTIVDLNIIESFHNIYFLDILQFDDLDFLNESISFTYTDMYILYNLTIKNHLDNCFVFAFREAIDYTIVNNMNKDLINKYREYLMKYL